MFSLLNKADVLNTIFQNRIILKTQFHIKIERGYCLKSCLGSQRPNGWERTLFKEAKHLCPSEGWGEVIKGMWLDGAMADNGDVIMTSF